MYERIRNLREDHDLKQEDIARLLHCTQACYSNYETASGTSQRRCFTPWQTTTTSASTICWGEPAGKSRTLNNNRPRQAYRCRGFFHIWSSSGRALRDIFRGPPAHCTFFRRRNTME